MLEIRTLLCLFYPKCIEAPSDCVAFQCCQICNVRPSCSDKLVRYPPPLSADLSPPPTVAEGVSLLLELIEVYDTSMAPTKIPKPDFEPIIAAVVDPLLQVKRLCALPLFQFVEDSRLYVREVFQAQEPTLRVLPFVLRVRAGDSKEQRVQAQPPC
jgi:hypothetical protein